MRNLESKLKIPQELSMGDAIKFYRANLSIEDLRECEVAEGTEYYIQMLVEKHGESLGK